MADRRPRRLEALIDAVADAHLDGLLVTCTCLRLRPRPDGWAVTISNAGHLPPILVAPGLDGPVLYAEDRDGRNFEVLDRYPDRRPYQLLWELEPGDDLMTRSISR